MRQVILDTETTGLEPELGHRIIEIGCIEIVNRRRTGRRLHWYLRPDREIDFGALQVHGITAEFLRGQPRFADVAAELREFISGAEVIIHNAPFDVAFLDREFGSLGDGAAGRLGEVCTVLDTLALARRMHPGQRNGLDALCKRYGVDNSQRDLHGALLDAELLLDVYLAMTGGQGALTLGEDRALSAGGAAFRAVRPAGVLVIRRATDAETSAHARILDLLDKASGGRTAWRAPALNA
jgi:DNA polymerase-3 subunit epsilon